MTTDEQRARDVAILARDWPMGPTSAQIMQSLNEAWSAGMRYQMTSENEYRKSQYQPKPETLR
jgi:hypothetical protein